MDSFVVMHNPDNNPLDKLEEFIREITSKNPQIPCSFTSSEDLAKAAIKGAIYVVSWQVVNYIKEYELGYKFACTINTPAPRNKPYYFRWKFKNTVRESDKDKGSYFDLPVRINSPVVTKWFDNVGNNLMKDIPPSIADELDKIFKVNCAKSFF